MENLMRSLWTDESGQDLVEYVLIVVLIALGVAAAMILLRGTLQDVFQNAADTLQTQASL